MDSLHLTPAHVHPDIDVWGNRQTFSFEAQESSFTLQNLFTPVQNIPSRTNCEFRNVGLNGFRFQHRTALNDTIGTLEFSSFVNAEHSGIPLLTCSPSEVLFHVSVKGNEPQVPAELTTKNYVDMAMAALPKTITLQGDVSGSGLVGSPVNTTFNKTLNQILNAGNINVGGYALNNVATPVFNSDAVHKSYVDTHTWNSSAIVDLSSFVNSHAVTSITAGTGLSGGTITNNGTIAIAPISGFLPGVYNWLNSLTINAQGQVIGANSGNQPITSIISNSGLTVNTSGGQSLINIFDTGVTPGTYTWPAGFSVNSMGQMTFVASSGSFPINRLSGYPSNSSVFLRGDGAWATPSTPTIDINNGTSGQLNLTRLQNFPYSSSYFLRGDGVWAVPNTNITLPLYLNTSNSSDGIIITNSNSNASATGLWTMNSNGQGVQFGFNNSTNEGYMWSSSNSSIKFGTNNSLRMIVDGSGNITHYDLTKFQSSNSNPCAWFFGYSLGAPFYGSMYVRPHANYLSNISRYPHNSALSTSFDCWSSTSGGSAIVMNGQFIQFIQNFQDLGIIFSDTDYDTSSNWQSYISASGNLIVSSSEQKKYSLRAKSKKDYLERLNRLNVYSYGLRCPIDEADDQTVKDRKYYKSKQLHVGLLSEEVKDLFENCTDTYKTIEVNNQNKEDFNNVCRGHVPSTCEEQYIDQKNKEKDIYGLNYNALLCYAILAIQELSEKVLFLETKRELN